MCREAKEPTVGRSSTDESTSRDACQQCSRGLSGDRSLDRPSPRRRQRGAGASYPLAAAAQCTSVERFVKVARVACVVPGVWMPVPKTPRACASVRVCAHTPLFRHRLALASRSDRPHSSHRTRSPSLH